MRTGTATQQDGAARAALTVQVYPAAAVAAMQAEPVDATRKRVPQAGEARANLHAGAKPVRAAITPREREICAAIGPVLKERGLIFVGIDVIGEYLTEINVTSPTGIREVRRFGGADIAALVWDAVEERVG